VPRLLPRDGSGGGICAYVSSGAVWGGLRGSLIRLVWSHRMPRCGTSGRMNVLRRALRRAERTGRSVGTVLARLVR